MIQFSSIITISVIAAVKMCKRGSILQIVTGADMNSLGHESLFPFLKVN